MKTIVSRENGGIKLNSNLSFILLLLCVSILHFLSGCTTAKYYVYDVSMAHPIRSNTLHYENDTFSIAFNLKPKNIGVTIYNKSNDGIRINWDEVSFSLNGKTFRAVHSQTGVANVNEMQPSTTIPPKSNLEDILIPRDKIAFVKSIYSGQTYTVQSDIFPIYDYGQKNKIKQIEALKGVRLTVYMPFYIRNQFASYYYDMIINDVVPKKKK